MRKLTFSLGVDLGTSNCAMALAGADEGAIDLMKITQVLGPNSIGEQKNFPSSLYFPRKNEFEDSSLVFNPRDNKPRPNSEASGDHVIGAFARQHGAQTPDRLITSAKSWLCNPYVDPRQKALPWHSTSISDEDKMSAYEATQCYLEHLKESFLIQGKDHHVTLKGTHMVLTVPASFNELARQLTIEAAHKAGFPDVSLMEEPQAAFYAWIEHKGDKWRDQVRAGDLLLVCDIGGGTSDFSLIAVTDKDGDLELERVSVGRHILLGGDNLDLALAYTLREQLKQDGHDIDNWQFLALVHASRTAKETLFSEPKRKSIPVAVPARGSKLIAESMTTVLQRSTLDHLLHDGFLPLTPVTETPKAQEGVGLKELGLDFEADPVISRHLAQFLITSHENVTSQPHLAAKMPKGALAAGEFLRPTAVLFNGGFFRAKQARERVLKLLHSWAPKEKIRELRGCQYDAAVALGACYYGLNKLTGRGVRIRAGAARSYYIGLETSQPSVPGFKPEIQAVCVVPQGMEEGTENVLDSAQFGLTIGQEVIFRFFSSNTRGGDTVGSILPHAHDDLEETASLRTTLAAHDGLKSGETVPVRLHSRVTEMGTLELWMQHVKTEQQWMLEFNVRTR